MTYVRGAVDSNFVLSDWQCHTRRIVEEEEDEAFLNWIEEKEAVEEMTWVDRARWYAYTGDWAQASLNSSSSSWRFI